MSSSPAPPRSQEFEDYRRFVKGLIEEKDGMETRLQEVEEELNQLGVGLHSSLVDADGFPIADIDHSHIRELRQLYSRLQNDHTAKMKEIEVEMPKLHAMARVDVPRTPTTPELLATPVASVPPVALPPAFLLVDAIFPGSPAHTAGFLVGDRIITFGTLSKTDIDQGGLRVLGAYLQTHRGQAVEVVVMRTQQGTGSNAPWSHGTAVTLSFVPQSWSGRGLLGCHVTPV